MVMHNFIKCTNFVITTVCRDCLNIYFLSIYAQYAQMLGQGQMEKKTIYGISQVPFFQLKTGMQKADSCINLEIKPPDL